MSTYQLLRNNKPSGPYTFEEIVAMGFKPYDLIWIEGKSAAWRYPGEIAEFKEHAPLVEEQPYDRFYKKKKPEFEVEKNIQFKKEKNYVNTEENFSKNNSLQVTSNSYVKEKTESKDYSFSQKNIVKQPSLTLKQTPENKITTPVEKVPQQEEKIIIPAAKVEYTGSLDEIKEMYRENLVKRNDEFRRKEKLRVFLRKVPAFLYVLVLGVLIGLTINVGKNKNARITIPEDNFSSKGLKQNDVFTKQRNQSNGDNYDMFTKTTGNIESNENLSPESEQGENSIRDKSLNEIKSRKKNNENNPVKNKSVQISGSQYDLQNNEVMNANNEASTEKIDAPPKKPIDIKSLVSITANDYKRGAFGGIKNLELKVKNSSGFLLDNVEVELIYLKPNEQPLKTEKIHFSSVAPNGSLTIQIPDNPRGVKVQYKIKSINSSGYADYVAGM